MKTEPQPGIGVDAFGGQTVDPTKNVLDLTAAAERRADDLRLLNDRRIDAEIRVLAVQMEGLERRSILRAEHASEIRQLETQRINAIRQVDVLAGNTAADRALIAIQTLATQTTAERETLRSLVTSSASTLAAQNAADLARINEAISALQKSSYEGAGKGTGAKNLWFVIAAVITVLGFMLLFGSMLVGVVLYISRAG